MDQLDLSHFKWVTVPSDETPGPSTSMNSSHRVSSSLNYVHPYKCDECHKTFKTKGESVLVSSSILLSGMSEVKLRVGFS